MVASLLLVCGYALILHLGPIRLIVVVIVVVMLVVVVVVVVSVVVVFVSDIVLVVVVMVVDVSILYVGLWLLWYLGPNSSRWWLCVYRLWYCLPGVVGCLMVLVLG